MAIDTLYWEITGACNLSCKHCHLGGPAKGKKLDKQEALDRIDLFAKNGLEVLLLTGGEPLVNPNVYDMIKRARGYGIDSALLTNGTLINEKRAALIKEADPSTVQISIDGLYEQHDNIRGPDAFSKIEKAIENLKAVDIYPLMKFTINKENMHEVFDVIEYCKSKDLRLNLSLVQELGSVPENNIMPTPEEYFELFVDLYQKKKRENLQLTLPDFSMEEYLETGTPKSGCSAGGRMGVITKEDLFLPCVFMSSLELGVEDGATYFSEKDLQEPNALCKLVNKHGSEEFGCPLRKFQYGKDPYSIYGFIRYLENETIQRQSKDL